MDQRSVLAAGRDPGWRPADLDLLRDRSVVVTHAGAVIEIAGSDAESWLGEDGVPAESLFREPGAFRILLGHFPDLALKIPMGSASLVLSGHLQAARSASPCRGASAGCPTTAGSSRRG